MALDIAKLEEEIKEEQSNINKQPETMNELYILLQQLGKAWREENAYIVNEGQKTSVQLHHNLTYLQLLKY